MSKQSNLRPHSAIMLDGPNRAPSRAMLYPTGFKTSDFEKPVIGIAEASLYFACQLAARVAIVTIIPRFRVPVMDMVAGYGLSHKVIVRTTPVYVLDVEKDYDGSMEKLRQECFRARDEDDAEAICLGCAGFAEFADGLEAELGIPVLDGVVCATQMAQSIFEMGRKTSKDKTYKFPER